MSASNYFDLDEILTETELCFCEFQLNGFNLASLEQRMLPLDSIKPEVITIQDENTQNQDSRELSSQSSKSADISQSQSRRKENYKVGHNFIKKNTQLDLPLWLILSLDKIHFAKLLKPKIFGNTLENSLLADASVVNLREKNNYFYEFGIKLLELQDKEQRTMIPAKIFGITLINRFKKLLPLAVHGTEKDDDNFVGKMSDFEKKIFDYVRFQLLENKNWWGCQNIEIYHKNKKIHQSYPNDLLSSWNVQLYALQFTQHQARQQKLFKMCSQLDWISKKQNIFLSKIF